MRAKMAAVVCVVALILMAGLLAACGGQEEPTEPPAAGDGAALLQERCAVCHNLDRVTQAQKTRDEWEQTVVRMVSLGTRLDDEEQTILIDYLVETYGP